MTTHSRASIAHVVAKLVARRTTRAEEVPQLVESVSAALTLLAGQQESESREEIRPEAVEMEDTAPPSKQAGRARRPRVVEAKPEEDSGAPVSEPAAPPPPRLVRRSEVMASPAPASEPALTAPVADNVIRGVVKWFDQRTRRGALRLPGHGGDVAVEPSLLDAMAITRLYKGQEVEATLSTEAAPRVIKLALPGGAWEVARTGGVVHNRHAKPVVVELKREALRRVAARAEAELLLGPGRERG